MERCFFVCKFSLNFDFRLFTWSNITWERRGKRQGWGSGLAGQNFFFVRPVFDSIQIFVMRTNFYFSYNVDTTMGQRCLCVGHMNAICYCLAVATRRFLPHPHPLSLTFVWIRFTRSNFLSASSLLEGNQVTNGSQMKFCVMYKIYVCLYILIC